MNMSEICSKRFLIVFYTSEYTSLFMRVSNKSSQNVVDPNLRSTTERYLPPDCVQFVRVDVGNSYLWSIVLAAQLGLDITPWSDNETMTVTDSFVIMSTDLGSSKDIGLSLDSPRLQERMPVSTTGRH